MSVLMVTVVSAITVLVLLWIVSAISVVAAIRRRERAAGIAAPRSMLAQLPMVLSLSLGLTVNLLVFVPAILWHRLRGKPLPPPPEI